MSGENNVGSEPSAGIFWGGVRTPETFHLLNEKTSLADSEMYGDFLTFSADPFEFWDRLARMSAAQLKRAGLPILLLDRDYEEFPEDA
jgi:hypothetical protein